MLKKLLSLLTLFFLFAFPILAADICLLNPPVNIPMIYVADANIQREMAMGDSKTSKDIMKFDYSYSCNVTMVKKEKDCNFLFRFSSNKITVNNFELSFNSIGTAENKNHANYDIGKEILLNDFDALVSQYGNILSIDDKSLDLLDPIQYSIKNLVLKCILLPRKYEGEESLYFLMDEKTGKQLTTQRARFIKDPKKEYFLLDFTFDKEKNGNWIIKGNDKYQDSFDPVSYGMSKEDFPFKHIQIEQNVIAECNSNGMVKRLDFNFYFDNIKPDNTRITRTEKVKVSIK